MVWPLFVAGTAAALQGYGQLQSGMAAEQAGLSDAVQLRANAKQSYAMGLRAAAERKREGDALMSDARAAIGAMGGDPSDAGSIDLLSKLDRENEYARLGLLYEAASEYGSGMRQASNRIIEGRNARKASRFAALGSVLGGAADVYSLSQPRMPRGRS